MTCLKKESKEAVVEDSSLWPLACFCMPMSTHMNKHIHKKNQRSVVLNLNPLIDRTVTFFVTKGEMHPQLWMWPSRAQWSQPGPEVWAELKGMLGELPHEVEVGAQTWCWQTLTDDNIIYVGFNAED